MTAERDPYEAARDSGFPCKVCGKIWTGHSRCHCTSCHETFSSISAFDKHRRDFRCRPPNDCGLILADGYWRHPGERPALPQGDEFQAAEEKQSV